MFACRQFLGDTSRSSASSASATIVGLDRILPFITSTRDGSFYEAPERTAQDLREDSGIVSMR